MTPHRHDPDVYAWQAVRARLSLDPRAHMALDEAVGDCVYCWKRIALFLSAEMVFNLIASLGGVYQNTKTGKTFGPAVDWAEDMHELVKTPPEQLSA